MLGEKILDLLDERGNIPNHDYCDILTGDSEETDQYNITCCIDCYRIKTCLKADGLI